MNNCCMDCEKRTPSCHAECEDYKKFVKQREEIRRKKAIEGDILAISSERRMRRMKRRIRK